MGQPKKGSGLTESMAETSIDEFESGSILGDDSNSTGEYDLDFDTKKSKNKRRKGGKSKNSLLDDNDIPSEKKQKKKARRIKKWGIGAATVVALLLCAMGVLLLLKKSRAGEFPPGEAFSLTNTKFMIVVKGDISMKLPPAAAAKIMAASNLEEAHKQNWERQGNFITHSETKRTGLSAGSIFRSGCFGALRMPSCFHPKSCSVTVDTVHFQGVPLMPPEDEQQLIYAVPPTPKPNAKVTKVAYLDASRELGRQVAFAIYQHQQSERESSRNAAVFVPWLFDNKPITVRSLAVAEAFLSGIYEDSSARLFPPLIFESLPQLKKAYARLVANGTIRPTEKIP